MELDKNKHSGCLYRAHAFSGCRVSSDLSDKSVLYKHNRVTNLPNVVRQPSIH